MPVIGFILLISGLLVVTYFSGPKSNSEQNNQPQPAQGQIETLPVKQAESSNYDYEKAKAAGLSDEEIQNYIATKSPNGTVTIRNKATGEIQKIPKSQLTNYVSSSKPQPKVVKASDKALKLSIYAFLASNEKQRNDLINKFSNGTNDLKEAIKNLALLLDSNSEAMAVVDKTVAQDIANKKSQEESNAVLEYNKKEYERLKAEVDSLPSSTNYTYTGGVQNTNTTTPKSETSQKNDPYIGSSLANDSSKYKGPTTYNVIGNTVYGSDGSTYNQIGNTIYKNDGTTYSSIGNTLYGSDGSSYSNIGNTTYSNDGTSYNQIGNTVYGSDGSTATSIGNTLYTYPGY